MNIFVLSPVYLYGLQGQIYKEFIHVKNDRRFVNIFVYIYPGTENIKKKFK